MVAYVMPKLGADMTAGKLVAWCKKVGDAIARGETIAVIETDKVNVDAESFVAGVLEQILVEPRDEWLPVGTPLALIRVEGEAAVEGGAPTAGVESPSVVAAPRAAGAAEAPGAVPAPSVPPITAAAGAALTQALHVISAPAAETAMERLRISPAARKRVLDLGIDPTRIAGTGPGGRVTLEDVERAAAATVPAIPPSAPARTTAGVPTQAAAGAPTPAGPADRQTRMREAIAAAMARAKREIPHYYLATTIDLASALGWLEARNRERPLPDRLLPGVLLIKAMALALREVPELNGFWRDGRAQSSDAIHIGVAISLRGGGLVAPALHHADRQSIDELMRNLKDLTQRARALSLRSSEMTDPTVTVTSLGERGAESVLGIIYPPQLALVGFGRIVERPWVVAGAVQPRPVVTATLAGDHRATDGHRGGLLLAVIERLLQVPEQL